MKSSNDGLRTEVISAAMLRPSGLMRAALCPASLAREAAMPPGCGEGGADAEEGTRLHGLIAAAIESGTVADDLDDDDAVTVKTCLAFWPSAVAAAAEETADLGGCLAGGMAQAASEAAGQGFVELELPIPDPRTGRALMAPGHADAVWISNDGRRALVVDWKTGQGLPTRSAARDHQLLAYVLGVKSRFPEVERATAWRFHPRLSASEPMRETGVTYGPSDWDEAWAALRDLSSRALSGGAARPGEEQCKWCRAKATCHEFAEWAEPPLALMAVNAPPAKASGELTLTPERLGELLGYRDRLALLSKAMSDAEALARRMLEAGESIPGPGGRGVWQLEPGRERRSVPDAGAAAKRLGENLGQETVLSCSTASVTALEKAWRGATGLKGREARERLEEALGDALERRPTAPRLVLRHEDDPGGEGRLEIAG